MKNKINLHVFDLFIILQVCVPTPGNREHTIEGHDPTHGALHVTPASTPSIQSSGLPTGTVHFTHVFMGVGKHGMIIF